MIDRIRRDIQNRLEQLLAEAEKLERAPGGATKTAVIEGLAKSGEAMTAGGSPCLPVSAAAR